MVVPYSIMLVVVLLLVSRKMVSVTLLAVGVALLLGFCMLQFRGCYIDSNFAYMAEAQSV
jgi:hypothetical protein